MKQNLSIAKLRRNFNSLFQSQNGAAISANTMCQLIIGIYEEFGLDCATSHSGRQILITSLTNRGISMMVFAEVAGHISIQTTPR